MRHLAIEAVDASPRPTRRRVPALAALVSALTVLSMLMASPALAAKGGGSSKTSGSSSLTLVLLDSTDGLAHYGQQVTFTVSTTQTTEPHVSLSCYQGSTLVYSAETGYYASYPWPDTQIFTLSSAAWTGGAASCTAVLYWFNGSKTVTGATLNFPVYA